MVSAALREIFNVQDAADVTARRHVLERLASVAPKVCALSEEDLTGFYLLPCEHWTKLRSTNPLERVNKEIGQRSDVDGIFRNDSAGSVRPTLCSSSRTMSGWSSAAISRPRR